MSNTVFKNLVWGALYFGFARLGLAMGMPDINASPVWFASGIALSAMILSGKSVIPGLWLGHMLANLTTLGPPSVTTFLASSTIGMGGILQAVIGCWLFKSVTGVSETFNSTMGPFKFAGTQALACLTSATIGTSSLVFAGNATPDIFSSVWGVWFIGDYSGVILVTPIVFTMYRWSEVLGSREKVFKFVPLCLILSGITHLIFSGNVGLLPLAFSYLPILLFTDYVVGRPYSYLAFFSTVIMIISYAVNGDGLFGQYSQTMNLILVDSFVISCNIVMMSFGAVIASHDLVRQKMLQEIDALTEKIDSHREIVRKIQESRGQTNLSEIRRLTERLVHE